MGWTKVDAKLKRKIQSYFVSCTEAWEMELLKEVIMDEMPFLNESKLSKAMAECCREITPPRPRSEYLKLLRKKMDRKFARKQKSVETV